MLFSPLAGGGKETVTFRGSGAQDTGFGTSNARQHDFGSDDLDGEQEPPAQDQRILPALDKITTGDAVRFLSLAEEVLVDVSSSEADIPCAQTKQHVSLTRTGAFLSSMYLSIGTCPNVCS